MKSVQADQTLFMHGRSKLQAKLIKNVASLKRQAASDSSSSSDSDADPDQKVTSNTFCA